MNESTFDPASFMTQEVEGEMETRYDPVPPSDYNSTIEAIDIRPAGDAIILDVTHLIHDTALAENMGMEKILVRQGIFLDIEPGGAIALGPNKNVKLGRLREAVNQNGPGKWGFQMLVGAGPMRSTVSNKPDKDDPTTIYSRVDKTLPLEAA